MLVDGGPDESVLSCLRQHVPWWRRRIDFLVLTHADSDHYSGLKSVLRQYQVDNLLLPLQGDANGNFAEFYQLVWQKRRQENLSKIVVIKNHGIFTQGTPLKPSVILSLVFFNPANKFLNKPLFFSSAILT